MIIKITPTGMAIAKRFALILNVLINQRQLRGIKTFTDAHDINYWNFSTFLKEPTKRVLKAEWLAYLVQDYNVNAEWLLTGIGNMFK